jgi:hypothetical protein
MGLMVVVCYKAKDGQEAALLELVQGHVGVLRGEGLVTQREPVIMRDASGVLVEVFEWASEAAARAAHSNAVVADLWARFAEVCTFEAAATLPEFHRLFAHFEPVN